MGRESDISKKRVLDLSKVAIEKTNACIAGQQEIRASLTALIDGHNRLSETAARDIALLKERVSAASNWAEGNETSLANLRTHVDGQIATLAKKVGELAGIVERATQNIDDLFDVHDFRLRSIVATLPPNGIVARLKWLLRGPKRQLVTAGHPFEEGEMPSAGKTIAEEHDGVIGLV